MQSVYPPPVDQLLRLGNPTHQHAPEAPAGYYAALGITPNDREVLLRMALDPDLNEGDPDSLDVWGPLHAWRALCEFRVLDAVLPLTALWESDDDWAGEDLFFLFPEFGPPVIDCMLQVFDDVRRSKWARSRAVGVIGEVGAKHSEVRARCIGDLAERLELYSFLPEELNAALVDALVELKAVECAPLIERAFAADAVAVSLRGDWIDVQYDLGLITELPAGRRPGMGRFGGWEFAPSDEMTAEQRKTLRKQRAKAAANEKKKRKQIKQQRKRNRNK